MIWEIMWPFFTWKQVVGLDPRKTEIEKVKACLFAIYTIKRSKEFGMKDSLQRNVSNWRLWTSGLKYSLYLFLCFVHIHMILTAFDSDTAVSSSDGRTQQLFKRNDVDNNDINDINDNHWEKKISKSTKSNIPKMKNRLSCLGLPRRRCRHRRQSRHQLQLLDIADIRRPNRSCWIQPRWIPSRPYLLQCTYAPQKTTVKQ